MLRAETAGGTVASATNDGSLAQAVTMPGVGISEAVPSAADAQVAVTAQTAFADCSAAGSGCITDAHATGTVTLARVTSTTVLPDQLQNMLVYVIRWDGFQCSPPATPNPPAGSAQNTAVPTYDCTRMVFIDAQTGASLGAFTSGTSSFDPNAQIDPPIRSGGKPSLPPPGS
jgi:hypothetical protein